MEGRATRNCVKRNLTNVVSADENRRGPDVAKLALITER
jgi:hypothetical protein